MKHINPLTFQLPKQDGGDNDGNGAAQLIRNKLSSIYAQAPDTLSQAEGSVRPGASSKHQKFMAELATSGKPFAQIQTEWHDYYQSLPNNEKHEVWNEFYATQESAKPTFKSGPALDVNTAINPNIPAAGGFNPAPERPLAKHPDSLADLKNQIASRVRTRGKLTRKQHLKSMFFGVSVGALFILALLFGLFNERFIAPFITPSRNVSNTPLIMDATAKVGTEPRLIIPKINVEVPVVYDVQTVDENAVQAGLERGVVHYATTSSPGEIGNGAIFGHSSNNILNKGQYKFAFVLLSRLEAGDTFYIEKDGVRYVYTIYDKKIVSPNEVSVLDNVPGKDSTMALITCDPPGTTINRLVVWGEQVSPDPIRNVASTALKTSDTPTELAGNAPSLWSRIWPF